jgi:ATP adenylyltransferase
MDILYAPWRARYFNKSKKSDSCPFCLDTDTQYDKDNLIIKRYTHSFVALNLHPYTSGHLLVIPYKHSENLDTLSDEERSELMHIISRATRIIQTDMNTPTMNVGINLGGRVAGGSIPEHLHVHIVPRSLGDTNFLTTTGDARVISESLESTYDTLKTYFEKDES